MRDVKAKGRRMKRGIASFHPSGAIIPHLSVLFLCLSASMVMSLFLEELSDETQKFDRYINLLCYWLLVV
jgi:hypothetical protein